MIIRGNYIDKEKVMTKELCHLINKIYHKLVEEIYNIN